MKLHHGLPAIVLAGAIVSGCTGQAGSPAPVTRAPAASGEASKAAASMNAFGFDFYKAALTTGGNAVVSPASIVIALSMARMGAAGETGSQMDTVLHSPGAAGLNSLDHAFSGLTTSFKDANGTDHEVVLRMANAPFAQRDEKWEQPYVDALVSWYGATLQPVDFIGNLPGAIGQINYWVSDQTQARIPQLLDKLDPLTRLVLVNAIYMKAPWLLPFDEHWTVPAPFTKLDGSKVNVVTMTGGSNDLRYAEGSGWQAVELPYGGGALAMTIVVPADLATFERSLTAERFATITGAFKESHMIVTLPRFKIETKSDLADALSSMGMPLAFDERKADFSGITKQEPLYIAAVVHQANISVDEKGTEASAATAVVAAATGMPTPPPEVHVDRPFIFAVRDTHTGAILFLGRVVDPSA